MKIFFFSMILFFLFPSALFAYQDFESFIQSPEGKICSFASDSCNTYILQNTSIVWSSNMTCPKQNTVWKCESKSIPQKMESLLDVKDIKQKQETYKKEILEKDTTLKNNDSLSLTQKPILQDSDQQISSSTQSSQSSISLPQYSKLTTTYIKKIKALNPDLRKKAHDKILDTFSKKMTILEKRKSGFSQTQLQQYNILNTFFVEVQSIVF